MVKVSRSTPISEHLEGHGFDGSNHNFTHGIGVRTQSINGTCGLIGTWRHSMAAYRSQPLRLSHTHHEKAEPELAEGLSGRVHENGACACTTRRLLVCVTRRTEERTLRCTFPRKTRGGEGFVLHPISRTYFLTFPFLCSIETKLLFHHDNDHIVPPTDYVHDTERLFVCQSVRETFSRLLRGSSPRLLNLDRFHASGAVLSF